MARPETLAPAVAPQCPSRRRPPRGRKTRASQIWRLCVVQRKYYANSDRREQPHYRQNAQENWSDSPRLAVMVPRCELTAQKIDALVIANLIKPQPGCERLAYRLQRLVLQPGKKLRGRQQHRGRVLPVAPLHGGADLFDLLIGEPVGFVEDEQRRGGLGRVR